MSKIARRVVLPLTTAAAMIVTAIMFAPLGIARSAQRGDQYLFGRDANTYTPIDGSLQVYGGNAYIHAPVSGDLLVIGGDISIADQGKIGGNIIYAGGRINGAEGRVRGRVYSLTTFQGAAATMTKSAVIVSLLFAWLIVAAAITLMSGAEVRHSSIEIRASALYCFALGLVAFTSFVLTAIVFSYLVPYLVGIPLLAALAVFAILTKVYGMIAVFHAVGTIVAGSRTREQLASRKWLRGDLAMVVIGVLILGAIRLIPVVGTIAWSFASIFGVGVALATRFGRREPEFLVWRPVRA
jgi:hypothetical protein